MDSNSQTININMSAEQKLDHIFNSMKEIKSSVLNLNSTVEELKNEQIILKSSLNNKKKKYVVKSFLLQRTINISNI